MRWMRVLLRRKRLQEQMDREFQLHIDLQTEEYVKAGLDPDEARFAAIRRFGAPSVLQEQCRDQNGVAWIETLWQDLRFGARTILVNQTSQPSYF